MVFRKSRGICSFPKHWKLKQIILFFRIIKIPMNRGVFFVQQKSNDKGNLKANSNNEQKA